MARVQLAPRVENRDDRFVAVIFVAESHLLQAGTMSERPHVVRPEPASAAKIRWGAPLRRSCGSWSVHDTFNP